MGQGHAVVARGNDPSAVFFNPAGIVQLDGTQFMLGLTPIAPFTTFTNEGTEVPSGTPQLGVVVGTKTDTENQVFFPPHLYLTHRYKDGVGIGLGLTSQFGLGTKWPENWDARYVSYNVDIKTLYLNPNIAVQLQPGWSMAAGLNYVYSTADLKNKIYLGTDEDLHIKDAAGDGWGYNLGMLVKLTENNTLGVSFRSPVKIHYEGDAEFTGTVFGTSDTDVQTDLTMPSLFSIGVANTSIPDLTLEFDLQWTGWSSIDSLNLDFANAVTDFSAPKNWNDVLALRFGGEYRLDKTMALRLGYVYDPTPIPDDTIDTLVPDSDRHDFSIGVGWGFENFTIDFAYMAIVLKERKVNSVLNTANPAAPYRLHGTYETLAHLAGLSLTYRF